MGYADLFPGFIEVGGYEELEHKFFSAYPNTTIAHLGKDDNYSYTDCGIPPANSYHMVRAADDGDLPWPGMFFGLLISSIWYWCSDQVRTLMTSTVLTIAVTFGGSQLRTLTAQYRCTTCPNFEIRYRTIP